MRFLIEFSLWICFTFAMQIMKVIENIAGGCVSALTCLLKTAKLLGPNPNVHTRRLPGVYQEVC